jgi:hypothetical protein
VVNAAAYTTVVASDWPVCPRILNWYCRL